MALGLDKQSTAGTTPTSVKEIQWTKIVISTPKKKVTRVIPIPSTEVAQLVAAEFGTSSVMYRIAACESTGSVTGTPRQFNDDGSLLRGRINPLDAGVFQINEHYHLADAERAGIDIHTVAGNIAWARVLFNRNGTRDWAWSAKCWNI